ncbi:MAG: hypothetical protein K0R57_1578 [Paenibacillaceae bacterium]|jgi:subtilisin family serine protease/flagellar hook assembly protein FlgD|nr:hypothetical protein [Paenibacillaceae bacterium]
MIKAQFRRVCLYLCLFAVVFTIIPTNLIQAEQSAGDNYSNIGILDDVNENVLSNVYGPDRNDTSLNSTNQKKKFLVGYKKAIDSAGFARTANLSKNGVKKIGGSNTFAVELNEAQAKELSNDPEVAYIESNATVIRASLGEIVPEASYQDENNQQRMSTEAEPETTPWGIKAIGADLAASNGYTGNRIKVAVLDTGISSHPDLTVTGGVSFVEETSGYSDDNGHGTHVAGTVAAHLNQLGVVGAAPNVELYSVKVLDKRGFGDYAKVIEGIAWAIENNMDIISMSFGGSEFSQALHDAIKLADASGLIIIAAAGNRGAWDGQEETELYPALYPEVISVGAVEKSFQRLYFSSIGAELDLMAPGYDILSTTMDGGYGYLSGTSMAAPHIAGAAAALWAQSPELSNQEIKQTLFDTATELGSTRLYGHGIVNLAKALGITEDAIPPVEVPNNNPTGIPQDFDINQYDKSLLSLSEQLLHLKERAQLAGKTELAKSIDSDYHILLAQNRKLHLIPEQESGGVKGADTAYYNEQFRMDYAAFNKLTQSYQQKINTYVSQLTSSIAGLSNISILSYNLIGDDQVIKQGQSASVECTLDSVKDINVQVVNSSGAIVKTDYITGTSVHASYVWQTGFNTPVSKYQIKFIYPDAPGWDDIFDINVKTGDQTIQQGQNATVTRILDDSKDVEVTVSDSSGQVVASEYVTNSPIIASYTWSTTSSTPVGTYTIHFHYPTDQEWDDYFIVNVVSEGSGTLMPGSPFNLHATTVDGQNALFSWSPGANSTSFEIYKNNTLVATDITANSFVFNNLTPDTNYDLGVKGKNVHGTGPMASISFRTTIMPPTTPGNVSIFAVTDSSITIHWDYQAGVSSYKLQLNGAEAATTSASSHTFQGLEPNTTYTINIAAVNTAGTSPYAAITTKTLPQMLRVGTPIDADIPEGQFGLYSFIPQTSGSYRIFTGYYGGFGAESDTILELYSDRELTQLVLEPSDDANGTVFSELNATLQEGTTYYIKLHGYDNNSVHARLAASLIAGIPEISLGTPIDVATQQNERRIYVFHPVETGSYTIQTGYYQGEETNGESDTILSVYNDIALSQLIDDGYNDDLGTQSRFSRVTVNLAANQYYYVVVEGYGNGAVQARLEVIRNSQNVFTPLTNKDAVDISNLPGKKAYYAFTPAEAGNYRFFTSPYQGNGQAVDTILELYSDPGLTQLIRVNDDVQGSHPYGELFSKIESTLETGRTYYIVVSSLQPSIALQTRVMVEDSFHASREKAIAANWNEIYEKDVSSLYDVDYYHFQITEPLDINYNVTAYAIFLEDSSGRLLQIFTPLSQQIYTIQSPGSYYARIHYYDGNLQTAVGIQANSVVQSYPVELADYEASSKKSGANNQVIDASSGYDKAVLTWEYSQFHEGSIAEVYDQSGFLIYKENIGYKLAGSHTYEWNGRTYNELVSGLQFDEDWDGVPERYYARNGKYTILIYPDDANRKHKAVFTVTVDNADRNISNYFEGIPTDDYDGIKVTSNNKQGCEKCFNYFAQYVWQTDEEYSADIATSAYQIWSQDVYGPSGLEKFWGNLGNYIYNPDLSPYDNIQNMITYVGLVPVIGEAADGVNGVIYLIRGDQVNAALSLAAMVPIIGDAAGSTQIVSKVGLKFFTRIDNFIACVNCFTAGTTVLTDDGDRPIEDINVGDLVLSKNPDTGEIAYKPVDQLYQKEITTSWVITIGEEQLTTTELHPFWVQDKGWVLTKDLLAGDWLERDDGSLIAIDRIEVKNEPALVYNFSVQDFHTYYVSSLGIFTHNTSCILPSTYLSKIIDPVTDTLNPGAIRAPTTTNPSRTLGEQLNAAELVADASDGVRWEAHHIVPHDYQKYPKAKEARDLLVNEFKIDLNSISNGMWMPREKGTPMLEVMDLDNLQVRYIAEHGKIHTKQYFNYVQDKLEAVYNEFGPDGMNLPLSDLQKRAVKELNGIRETLMNQQDLLGLINNKWFK